MALDPSWLAQERPPTPNYKTLGFNIDSGMWEIWLGRDVGWLEISNPGNYTLPAASTTVLGGVKIDGTTVTISGGVISAAGGTGGYTLPTASTTVLGGVKIDGSSVTISNGVISASGVGAGVSAFNTRTGSVTLSLGDVTAALTYTPYNASNPSGYQTAADVGISVTSAISGLATTAYVDSVAQGLDAKQSVLAATTANIALSATQTLDGVPLFAGNRVLVKDQVAPANNGIYVVASGAWTRALDADTWIELPAAYVFVEQGAVNADTGWVCTSNPGGTLGTTAVTWTQFSSSGTVNAGAGLTKTGTTIDVIGTANRISVLADSVDIDAAYIGQSSITTVGTISSGSWNGSIGAITPSPGAFTTLAASGAVSGAGFTSLLTPYAPLASPTFTGIPSGPTATVGTNTTQLATTAFVIANPGGYTLPAATASVLGGVMPDGTTLANTAGAISVAYGTTSTTAAAGNDARITGAQTATNVVTAIAAGNPGAFSTLSASGLVSGTGFLNRFASAGPIGSVTPSTGAFSTLSATGQISSTLATGTAPFSVASTTNVPNLNASSLSGATFAAPGAIGGTTPAAGAFTTLAASGAVTGAGFTALQASPGPIGSTAPSTGAFTTLAASGAVTGAGITALHAAPGPLGSTTPSTGAFTTLSATSTISGAGFTAWMAAPGPIGSTTPSTGAFTTLSATGAVSGAGITARFAVPGPIGNTTPSTGAFTTLSASGAVSGAGFSAFLAGGAVVITTVSAAGTTQGTATVLAAQFNAVTTVAAGTGVMATPGYTKIWNAGANPLLVYPISTAQFDAIGTNLPIMVPVGGGVEIVMTTGTQGYAR